MQNAPIAEVRALPLFPDGAVPDARRKALEAALSARRLAGGRAFSSGFLMALCAGFSLFYGACSAYFWSRGMAVAVGSLFAILSAITFVGAVRMAVAFAEHWREIVPVPGKLRHEAAMEETLAAAALESNVRAILWNRAYEDAVACRASVAILRALEAQRVALDRQRSDIADRVARYVAAVTPPLVPTMVPVPSRWGHTETVDIDS